MSGFAYWDPDDPYTGIEVRGRLGADTIFRVSYGVQQCFPYVPAGNPQTPRQQMWRFIFTQAVLHWRSLTNAQRAIYNRAAARRGRLTGFNWAVSDYLTSYTHVLE